jgi:hypothetical protein
MRTPARATLGVASVATLLAATCSGGTETVISVSAVTPASAYNNQKVDLVIQGGPFRPAYDIETDDGKATTQLGAFTAYLAPRGIGPRVAVDSLTWLSTSALAATLRADVPPGLYDVEVVDPRGAFAQLPKGFESLGRDEQEPVVHILGPADGTIVNPSAEVPVSYEADDELGTLDSMHWTVSSPGAAPLTGTCPLNPNATQSLCRLVFVVPPTLKSGASLIVNVDAIDVAGNKGRDQRTLSVGLPPIVSEVSPQEGLTEGGDEIAIEGQNFIPGTQVLLGGALIDPNGGTVVDEHLIRGKTPPHEPGTVPVVVRTGGASVEAKQRFTFRAKPSVLAVSPNSGPPAGGTPVAVVGKGFRKETVISFGDQFETSLPIQCPTLVSANRIEGFAPPGLGAVAVWAADPVSGTGSQLDLAFTYLTEDSPDGSSVAAPQPCPGPDGGIP